MGKIMLKPDGLLLPCDASIHQYLYSATNSKLTWSVPNVSWYLLNNPAVSNQWPKGRYIGWPALPLYHEPKRALYFHHHQLSWPWCYWHSISGPMPHFQLSLWGEGLSGQLLCGKKSTTGCIIIWKTIMFYFKSYLSDFHENYFVH